MSSSVVFPSPEASRNHVCKTCKIRYVEPNDLYIMGKRKGEPQDNCLYCRGTVLLKDFPPHLLVPKAERRSKEKALSVEHQWLASLDPEQEGLLLHNQKTNRGLSSDMSGRSGSDISRASCHVHWSAITERLRDIYSLDRLFEGFESLETRYKIGISTVFPSGLLAVCLNNSANRTKQPCKSYESLFVPC